MDKNTRYELITRVQSEVFNMNSEISQQLFDEDQELELQLYRAIRNLLKKDAGLVEKLMADINAEKQQSEATPEEGQFEELTL